MTEQTTRQKVAWAIGAIVIIIWALFPVAWIISLSLKPPTDLQNGQFFPTHWSTVNYSTVFQTSLFTTALRNSIGIVGIATLVSVVLATLTAYAIARLDFPGKKFIL